ncbi:MAG: hypothetical protein E3K36_03685 [Candidatus Brocadia sp.]|nr:hypothetical protein [Candidatus Brocadia sp.]
MPFKIKPIIPQGKVSAYLIPEDSRKAIHMSCLSAFKNKESSERERSLIVIGILTSVRGITMDI